MSYTHTVSVMLKGGRATLIVEHRKDSTEELGEIKESDFSELLIA